MLLITVPHSGETVPNEASWLMEHSNQILLTDVDRFVDILYADVCSKLKLNFISASFHRYAVDLNRIPTDIDSSIVTDPTALYPSTQLAAGQFVSGIHWKQTTKGYVLMKTPIANNTHQTLITNYYDKFHAEVRKLEEDLIKKYGLPRYHLDLHSMPSRGTSAHKDNGAERPDIVVSDCEGKSSATDFKDAVINAYEKSGFKVAYNWPYKGGRMTETYGNPAQNKNSLQIELNRKLYMDETTKEKNSNYSKTKSQLEKAVNHIAQWVAASKKV